MCAFIVYVKRQNICIGRESNPGLPRGRRELYHSTTDALCNEQSSLFYDRVKTYRVTWLAHMGIRLACYLDFYISIIF